MLTNKKVSLSFCLIFTSVLFSFSGILVFFSELPNAFTNFTIIGLISSLCSLINKIAPFVLLALLVLNSLSKEKNLPIKDYVFIALIVLGGANLISGLMSLRTVLSAGFDFGDSITILAIMSTASALSLGALLILAAFSIKNGAKHGLMKIVNAVAILLSVFSNVYVMFFCEDITPVVSGVLGFVFPLFYIWGVFNFVDTILSYDTCKKLSLVSAIAIIVAILLLNIITSVLTGTDSQDEGCGHESCEKYGPFPCYGQNNTCPNKTDCSYDLYCDSCD